VEAGGSEKELGVRIVKRKTTRNANLRDCEGQRGNLGRLPLNLQTKPQQALGEVVGRLEKKKKKKKTNRKEGPK